MRPLRTAIWLTLSSGCAIVTPLDDTVPTTDNKTQTTKRDDAGSRSGANRRDAAPPDDDASTAQDKDASPKTATDAGSAGRGTVMSMTMTMGMGKAGAGGRAAAPAAGSGGSGQQDSKNQHDAGPPMEKIGDVIGSYFERISARINIACDCTTTVADKASCRWLIARKQHIDCMTTAFERIGSAAIAPIKCASEEETRWAECNQQASCSQDALKTCSDTHLAARSQCNIPDDVLVSRCAGVYSGLTGSGGFMPLAAEWTHHICRCGDGMPEESSKAASCEEAWHTNLSQKTVDCAANLVYDLEASNLNASTSPAITLLDCVNKKLRDYSDCMSSNAPSCEAMQSESCGQRFTDSVVDDCGVQGVSLFACIAPT